MLIVKLLWICANQVLQTGQVLVGLLTSQFVDLIDVLGVSLIDLSLQSFILRYNQARTMCLFYCCSFLSAGMAIICTSTRLWAPLPQRLSRTIA